MDERRPPRLLGWVVQVGFTLAFAIVALLYGLWFGQQLIVTQRAGVESIRRIEVFEQEEVYQLRQISERLDRIEITLAAGTSP